MNSDVGKMRYFDLMGGWFDIKPKEKCKEIIGTDTIYYNFQDIYVVMSEANPASAVTHIFVDYFTQPIYSIGPC